MRIISTFHDYYDCMLKHDSDRDTIFFRKPKEVFYKEYSSYLSREHCNPLYIPTNNYATTSSWRKRLSISLPDRSNFEAGVIIFCDTIYPYLYFHILDNSNVRVWDAASAYNFLEATYNQKERRWWEKNYKQLKKALNLYFTITPQYKEKVEKFQQEERAPIIIVSSKENIFNGSLSDFDFAKILSPAMAYQKLLTWMCNQATPMKPVPEMSDAIKIQAHGYDKKSFRKEPRK